MKVIQILNHSLSSINPNADPRFYEDDWHAKVAKSINKQTNEFDLECWRPEKNLKEIYKRTGTDGIVYKLFPSKYFHKIEYSSLMLQEIENEIEKSDVLLHFHGIFYPSTYYLLKNLPTHIPIIAQSHASSPTLIRSLFDNSPLRSFEFIEKLIQKKYFNKIDQFFCLSQEEVEEFSKYGNAVIQPMGIDFNRFKPLEKEFALKKLELENKDYILFVGRIDKIKGLNYLIEALKELVSTFDITLLIAGEGPYKSELKAIINDLEMNGHVKFLGFIENEKLIYLYNISSVTVYPSLWESYGVVPIESLACKTPIITTDVGATVEIVNHFHGGFQIIPARNSKAITDAFNKMKTENFDNKNIDRDSAKDYHDWNSIISKTIQCYHKLMNNYY